MVNETGKGNLLARGARLGPFIIEERLLDRTFWETYRARDTKTGQEAEVQCVDAHAGEHVPRREEFLDVLERVRAIENASVLKVISGGIEGDIHWVARAWVRGVPVLSHRAEVAPPTMEEALADGAFFSAALAAASRVGIVHGNVNPRVCVVTRHGPMVLDIGSRALFGLSHEDALETPVYRAPEQLLGKAIDARADVYSLGMVLYEILAGEVPFSREAAASLEDFVMAILTKMPDAPSPKRVHPVVTSILEAMYAKDARARYGIERVCSALCTVVRLLRNERERESKSDSDEADVAAAPRRKRAMERKGREKYFEPDAVHAVSSGDEACGKGDAADEQKLLLPLPTPRSREDAAPLEGASAPLPVVEQASSGSRTDGDLPGLSERFETPETLETPEPSPQTQPSFALRQRGVIRRSRRALTFAGGLLTLVLLVCAQRAFESRVEARAVPVLSKAARLVGALEVKLRLAPMEEGGVPPVPAIAGVVQGEAPDSAAPLVELQPKAAKRGMGRRVAAAARAQPSAATPPLLAPDDPALVNDWD
jgi:serine/threonine protein kinase